MKSIVILSGGLDSTTLLYWLLDRGDEVKALSFNYGQRHKKELEYAKKVAELVGVEHRVADLTAITDLLGGSSQTDSSIQVPDGHYSADSMAVTVVPNRNSIMLNIAAGWAMKLNFNAVVYGAHKGDFAQYADCRPEHAEALAKSIELSDYKKIQLERPFIYKSKADIAAIAKLLNVPVHLTWSCYKGLDVHCGRCGTCVERLESLHLAGVDDKTSYQDPEYWKAVTAQAA